MSRTGEFSNGSDPIDFDTWHEKAFRIATTPSGAAINGKGETLPDEPGRWSIVTPENGDAWHWPAAPKETITTARDNWHHITSDPGADYKMQQIRRAMTDGL